MTRESRLLESTIDALWAIGYDPDPGDPDWTDVRLQLESPDDWTGSVHFGDASYDLDHSGSWGASGIDYRELEQRGTEYLREIAWELVQDALDHEAQGLAS